MAFPWLELGEGVVLAWLGASRVLDSNRTKKRIEFEKRRVAELKLKGNPERCGDHETRLRAVESKLVEVCTNVGDMKDDIREIKSDIKDIKESEK